MELQFKVIVKRPGHDIYSDNFEVASIEGSPFVWEGTYKGETILTVRMKKGWSIITATDVSINWQILKSKGITLWDDCGAIAQRLNHALGWKRKSKDQRFDGYTLSN